MAAIKKPEDTRAASGSSFHLQRRDHSSNMDIIRPPVIKSSKFAMVAKINQVSQCVRWAGCSRIPKGALKVPWEADVIHDIGLFQR
jgi:hypothetical protein